MWESTISDIPLTCKSVAFISPRGILARTDDVMMTLLTLLEALAALRMACVPSTEGRK